jgi:hypothetical protein
MSIWQLRELVESRIMVWHATVAMLAVLLIALFGFIRVRKW